MKKILIEGMSSNLGGIETYVHLLYTVLKNDHQVDFITVDPQIPFEEEFLSHGCQIHRITSRSKDVRQYCADIDRVFQQGHYDVFWFNKTTLSSIYPLKSAKKHGVGRVIVHSHQSRNMGSFFTLIMHTLHRFRVSRYADVKAACSQEAAVWFFGKHTDDVVIFQNAVDTARFEPSPAKQQAAKEMLGVENRFVIGNIARFSPEKNHTFLIEVFAEILKKADAHLLLCGEGQTMDAIRSLVAEKHITEHVSFLGSRKDMPVVYQAMDVVVMPSLFEGLPFSLVEAQAAGIPCVVSDTVSPESRLTDIITYMSLQADASLWAEQVLSFRDYQKCSKKEQLQEKGFTVEAFAQKVTQILKQEG